MTIDPKLVEELLADYKKPEDIIGENGLLKQITKAILERALKVELTEHVGYEKHDPAGHNSGNSRNRLSRITYLIPCIKLTESVTRREVNVFAMPDNVISY